MPSAAIELTIALCQEDMGRGIVFHKWIPTGPMRVWIESDRFQVQLIIDETCVNYGSAGKREVSSMSNVDVNKVIAVSEGHIPDERVEAVARYCAANPNYDEIAAEKQFGDSLIDYYRFGRDAYIANLRAVNRLIGYVRAKKCQYWLDDCPIQEDNCYSEFLRHSARISFDGVHWSRLCAPRVIRVIGSVVSDACCVKAEDWLSLSEQMLSTAKAPLVGQLLAASNRLRRDGHRRASLVEAVTALEVAIGEFSRRAKEGLPRQCRDLGQFPRLDVHIERIGITCTLNYLLPLILQDGVVSKAALDSCKNAYDRRNTVVHKGARDVDDESLKAYIQAIRELCLGLDVL